MAFDGIITKAISSELQELAGARIDKIIQPDKNSIILGCYLNGTNYAINTCIDAQYCRINLTTHPKPSPKIAPNFSMVLRKHLLGLRIKNIFTLDLERIVIIEFEGFDDIDDLITKKLIIELMGKHSNIILIDDTNIIIDSLRHTKNIEEGHRNIFPHTKYEYPTTTKKSFLDIQNFEDFSSNINLKDDFATQICNTYNGISKSFIYSIISDLNIKAQTLSTLNQIFDYINNIISNIGTTHLSINTISQNEKKKDFYLTIKDNTNPFGLNFFIDNFYYSKESSQQFKNYRDSILKLILNILKKYNKRLLNINNKLEECKEMDKYKLYGELITSNLYKIPNFNTDYIELENYYENNALIKIPLDKKYSPNINAKRYFKKYNKLKNAMQIVSIQKEETINDLNYIESIIYELETASTVEEIAEIYEEISANVIFKSKTDTYNQKKKIKIKKSKLTKNKNVSFNPIKYSFNGYNILVGRNNIENDYLTLKYANKSDIWFHTKDIHGSHVILIAQKDNHYIKLEDIKQEILEKCAELAAFHSKAKNSSNVPVDYCLVKYVKKPSGSKPGMVIYTTNKTLYVTPKK